MMLIFLLSGAAALLLARCLWHRILDNDEEKHRKRYYRFQSPVNIPFMSNPPPPPKKRSRKGRFEISQSSDGQFYFRFKAGNGETICIGEMHPQKAKARHSVEVLKDLAADAEIVDLSPKKNNAQ
jgi:uncharacterized protein